MSKDDSKTPNGDKKEDVPPRIDLETLLVTEIGQFGKYQARLLAIATVASAIAAFGASEYLFTTARIATRCLIPECENPASQLDFSPYWILNAVPSSGSSFDNCRRYTNTSASTDGVNGTCPAVLFNQNVVENCEEYVYQNTHSVVYSYDLGCDEWGRSLIGSVRTFGTLVALPLTGFVSDRWGRRTALAICAFNSAWIGITRYWADTYVGFVISQFAESLFGSGMFSCLYILLMELVGPKFRVMVGATANSFFSVGQMMVGLIAWGVPNWRNLTLTLYVPQLLVVMYYFIIPESIRWYQSKGKHDMAETELKKIAKANGKQLSEKTLVALRETAEEANRRMSEKKDDNEPLLIVQVFRNRPILIRCLVSPIWWITLTFTYYGLSVNAVNMIDGNPYLNYVLVAAVEIPGFWMAVALMNRIGRRPVLMLGYWVCAACMVAYIFIPEDLYGLSLTVYLVGKAFISMVGTTMYVYTAELYPTKYRHSLFAFSSMVGRIGSILAPLTPALNDAVWENVSFVIFAVLAVVSGGLILVAPETLGNKMPDTMEQAANIGRKKLNEENTNETGRNDSRINEENNVSKV